MSEAEAISSVPSGEAKSGASGARFSGGRLLMTIIVVLAIAAVAYRIGVSQVQPPADNERFQRVIGLGTPVQNRLAGRYTDNDGDLVADPPDASQQVDPDVLYFSFIATEDPEQYRQVWLDFVEHLSEVTGKRVEYVLFESRDDQLKALRDGNLHVTGVNTGAVPMAVNICGFVPVCTPGKSSGEFGYTMQLIVPADSVLNRIEDIRGHQLVLTQPNSNSGFKAPLVILKNDFGLVPDRDYEIVNSYSHEASIAGIVSKEYEVAAVASDMVDRAKQMGQVNDRQYRVIYRSESFPSAGLGYVYNLEPGLAGKVREAFFTYEWAGSPLESEYAGSGSNAFVPVTYKDHFALIRRIDDASGYKHDLD